MIVDLHSHYLPAEAARAADVPVRLEPLPDGGYRFAVGRQELELERALTDLSIQVADMHRQRLERRILCIPPFCLQYELVPDDGLRWARAINDGIAEAARTSPDVFVGFATLPLQDVPAAVAELDRAVGTLGLHGVEIASHIAGVELDDPVLEPFWERAARYRVPILVHPHNPAGADRMGGYYLRNLVGNPVDTALAGARLLLGGVVERHPDLVVILAHGGGALPGIIGRLAHGYQVRPEARLRASEPAQLLRRLYFDTIVFDARTLRYLVGLVGASQVVLGTDYPFDMGEERPAAFVESAGLPDEDARTVLENGARLLERVLQDATQIRADA
jgi:aminocarboxymuconate-semialdehyde decarboxylase